MLRRLQTIHISLAVADGEVLTFHSYVGRKSQFGQWLAQEGITDYEIISYTTVVSEAKEA